MEISKHGLRPELKLRDLVLMQVVLIFSLNWAGFAAKQGSTQVVLWLIAINSGAWMPQCVARWSGLCRHGWWA